MVSFLEGVMLGVSLTLPLGPVTIEILRRGLASGWKESLKTAIGAFTAELTYFSLVFFGIASLSMNPVVDTSLALMGVFFLFFLGYENMRSFFAKKNSARKKIIGKNPYFAGFAITFFSPLNLFMWAGIIGGFFKDSSIWQASSVLFGILPSLLIFTFISMKGRRFVSKNMMRYVSLVAGIFFIFYGAKLAQGFFFSS